MANNQSLKEGELGTGLDHVADGFGRASLGGRARGRQVKDFGVGDVSLVGLSYVVGDFLSRHGTAALVELDRNALGGIRIFGLGPDVGSTSNGIPGHGSLAIDGLLTEVGGILHPVGLDDATEVLSIAAEAAVVVFGVVQVQLIIDSVLVAGLVLKVVSHSAERLPSSVVEINAVEGCFRVGEVVVERA